MVKLIVDKLKTVQFAFVLFLTIMEKRHIYDESTSHTLSSCQYNIRSNSHHQKIPRDGASSSFVSANIYPFSHKPFQVTTN